MRKSFQVNKAGHDVNIHTIPADKCKKPPFYATLHYRSKGQLIGMSIWIFLLNPKAALREL